MINLIDLEVYKVAMEIGDRVWVTIDKWDYFNKDTLGKQFVRSPDSIAFNIAEGYGRFFFKENKNFNYYSRGSAFECTFCLRKAFTRQLITAEENIAIRNLFARYFRLINGYIKSIGTEATLNEMKESEAEYSATETNNLDSFLSNDLLTK